MMLLEQLEAAFDNISVVSYGITVSRGFFDLKMVKFLCCCIIMLAVAKVYASIAQPSRAAAL
jgi:hypothetical protein